MAIFFPKINQLRFHLGSNDTTTIQNMDNRASDIAWEQGVYPHRFYQPIPKIWTGNVGDGNELDFMIVSNSSSLASQGYYVNLYKVATFDKYSNPLTYTAVETLSSSLWFTYADGRLMYRYTKSLGTTTAGHYIIRIESVALPTGGGVVYYQSNVFNIDVIANFGECKTFSCTHDENDFGIVWINAVPTTWHLKIVIPFRMYKPQPKAEKIVYGNDTGLLTTLRTTMNRVFEFETYPIPMWYAETITMALALRTTYLNKILLNFESIPTVEPIADSDLCVLKGLATDVNFNENYYLNL